MTTSQFSNILKRYWINLKIKIYTAIKVVSKECICLEKSKGEDVSGEEERR